MFIEIRNLRNKINSFTKGSQYTRLDLSYLPRAFYHDRFPIELAPSGVRLAEVEHIEEAADVGSEFRDRLGLLPEPADNLLYIFKIKVLAARARVSSVSAQGRQIVIKPRESIIAGRSCEPKARQAAKQSLDKSYDGAVKIGATQIRLDTRLLSDRWGVVLEEILSSNCE